MARILPRKSDELEAYRVWLGLFESPEIRTYALLTRVSVGNWGSVRGIDMPINLNPFAAR